MEKLPGAKGADPRRFVDFTILDELEKEGFVKNLYRTESASVVIPRRSGGSSTANCAKPSRLGR